MVYHAFGVQLVWPVMIIWQIIWQKVGMARAKLVWHQPHQPYGILHPWLEQYAPTTTGTHLSQLSCFSDTEWQRVAEYSVETLSLNVTWSVRCTIIVYICPEWSQEYISGWTGHMYSRPNKYLYTRCEDSRSWQDTGRGRGSVVNLDWVVWLWDGPRNLSVWGGNGSIFIYFWSL